MKKRKERPASVGGERNRAKRQKPTEPVAPSVSPAWEKLKAQGPGPAPVRSTEAGPGLWHRREVIPGKCTCDHQRLETGERLNPWVYGHATWCSMFAPKCPDCGCSSGTHTMECAFWAKNPTLSPF